MERTKIIELLNEHGYPTFMLNKTADKVESFSPFLEEAFEKWALYGIEPSFVIKGYSFASLIENFKMNPIGAFITLDWIMREPEEAIEKLNDGIK